jgi:hypothetical protein
MGLRRSGAVGWAVRDRPHAAEPRPMLPARYIMVIGVSEGAGGRCAAGRLGFPP